MLPELKIGNLVARYPIIQGGMGVGISLSSLAGAVAKAGGIGVISAAQPGWRDPEFARDPLSANLRALAFHIRRAELEAYLRGELTTRGGRFPQDPEGGAGGDGRAVEG